MELTDEQKQIVLDNPLGINLTVIQGHIADHYTVVEPTVKFAKRLLRLLATDPLAAEYLEPTREQNPAYRAGPSTLLDLLLEVANLLKSEHLELLPDLVDKLAAPVSSVAVGEVSDEETWLAVIAFVREFYIEYYSLEPKIIDLAKIVTPADRNFKPCAKGATLDDMRKMIQADLSMYTYREVPNFNSKFFTDPWTLHLYEDIVRELRAQRRSLAPQSKTRLRLAASKLNEIKLCVRRAAACKRRIVKTGVLKVFADNEQKSQDEAVAMWDNVNKLLTGSRNYIWAAHTPRGFEDNIPGQINFFIGRRLRQDKGSDAEPREKRQKVDKDSINQKPHLSKNLIALAEHEQTDQSIQRPSILVASYLRNIMSVQPFRRIIHGLTLRGKTMELWAYHHSGTLSSGTFDITTPDGQDKFATALAGYAYLDDETLGLCPLISETETGEHEIRLTDEDGAVYTYNVSQPIYVDASITGRTTAVFRVGSNVLKTLWGEVGSADREARALKLLEEHNVDGIPRVHKYIGNISISSFADYFHVERAVQVNPTVADSLPTLQATLTATSEVPHTGDEWSSQGSCRSDMLPCTPLGQLGLHEEASVRPTRTNTHEAYSSLSAMITSPAGRPIFECNSLQQIILAIADAVLAHWRCVKEGVLHRDISDRNIIIVKNGGNGQEMGGQAANTCGYLIGFGNAKIGPPLIQQIGPAEAPQQRAQEPELEVRDQEDIAAREDSSRQQRSQTMRYVAPDVLKWKVHTAIHDLQSFYFLLVYLFAVQVWKIIPRGIGFPEQPKPGYESVFKIWDEAPRSTTVMTKGYVLHAAQGLEEDMEYFPKSLRENRVLEGVLERVRQIVSDKAAPIDGASHAEIARLIRTVATSLPNETGYR